MLKLGGTAFITIIGISSQNFNNFISCSQLNLEKQVLKVIFNRAHPEASPAPFGLPSVYFQKIPYTKILLCAA
jgi:hypothetical protein